MTNVKLVDKTESGIETYRLENENAHCEIITFGARISKLAVKNRYGEFVDVVAGFVSPDDYRNDRGTYFGAIVGRVANRIEKGKFTLDGKEYHLYCNDGENHLHGGKVGFSHKIWTAKINEDGMLSLHYFSTAGEEGYPANLDIIVTYSLEGASLSISYRATSDAKTLCSLTNHAYFNLDGDFESVLEHELCIASHAITSVDEKLIPHGEILDVAGTPFDFSTPKQIGRDIRADEPLLKIAKGGYDFNYILDCEKGEPCAVAFSQKSGLKMSVITDLPCVQLYTGNFLDGFAGKRIYPYQSAFCLETQGYPNACNVESFDSIVLEKGEVYETKTTYKFECVMRNA